MALPASPPISLSQVCTEFGAPAGTPLASFLRGGAWVPNIAQNAGVPTALPIGMLDLLGASATGPVSISDHSVDALVIGAGICNALFQMDSSGAARSQINGGAFTNYSGEWLVSGAASAYDIQYVHLSGAAPTLAGATYGTWVNGASTSTASLAQGSGAGARYGSVQVNIRPAGGGATLDTAVIYLTVERL